MPPASGTRAGGRRARVLAGRGGQSLSRYPRSTRCITSGRWDPECTRKGVEGRDGDEFLTFILFRRYDAPPVE